MHQLLCSSTVVITYDFHIMYSPPFDPPCEAKIYWKKSSNIEWLVTKYTYLWYFLVFWHDFSANLVEMRKKYLWYSGSAGKKLSEQCYIHPFTWQWFFLSFFFWGGEWTYLKLGIVHKHEIYSLGKTPRMHKHNLQITCFVDI